MRPQVGQVNNCEVDRAFCCCEGVSVVPHAEQAESLTVVMATPRFCLRSESYVSTEGWGIPLMTALRSESSRSISFWSDALSFVRSLYWIDLSA